MKLPASLVMAPVPDRKMEIYTVEVCTDEYVQTDKTTVIMVKVVECEELQVAQSQSLQETFFA